MRIRHAADWRYAFGSRRQHPHQFSLGKPRAQPCDHGFDLFAFANTMHENHATLVAGDTRATVGQRFDREFQPVTCLHPSPL